MRIISIISLCLAMISCGQNAETAKVLEPAENYVIAHCGGGMEAGLPDNSIAALEYAISLGCMASECDIYWTKDNNVIVTHADMDNRINGLYPWEHTLAEIRSGGKLSNGEEIPTLEEYLDCLMGKSRCTKLWIDIKGIYNEAIIAEPSINACRRACEIISAKKAEQYTEFICTGIEEVMEQSHRICLDAGIPIAWMSPRPAVDYLAEGYEWANVGFYNLAEGGKDRQADEYLDAGLDFSVYTVDEPELMDVYLQKYGKRLKGITTNYPARLLEKLK